MAKEQGLQNTVDCIGRLGKGQKIPAQDDYDLAVVGNAEQDKVIVTVG